MGLWVLEGVPRARPASPGGRASSGIVPALLGLLGFVISFAGSWRPSFWGDEGASVMSAERSLPSLFRMLGNVDAVHGTYYLFLHYWTGLFGSSELSARLPSAIAIGVATAGTFVLARSLVNERLALVAALVFVILPRVTYSGAEARSAALATAVAVWSTVILVRGLRATGASVNIRRSLWAGYAALLAAGIYLFLDFALILPAHALAVLVLSDAGATRKRMLGSWGLSTAIALVVAGPVLFFGLSEHEQIAFLATRPPADLRSVAVIQWFGNVPLAILAWALILLGVATVFAGRHLASAPATTRRELAVILAWSVVPTAALVLGSRLGAPMYAPRYLAFCTPAIAIAIAVGILAIRIRWIQVSAVALAVALAAPTYLSQRGEFAKSRSDWRQASEVVEAGASPGDAVVFYEDMRPSRRPRLALHLYPEAFQGLRDVTLDEPFHSTDGLWDTTFPLASVATELSGTNRVWLLHYVETDGTTDETNLTVLQRLGFTIVDSTTFRRTTVIEMAR